MNDSINLWAVFAAAASNMVIGALWYGPVFGKLWMRLAGLTKDSMRTMPLSPKQAMGLGFVGALLMAYVLAHFADAFAVFDVAGAWQLGFWTWLGIAVPITAGSWLWEGKPFKLFVLNAAYWCVTLNVVAVILAFYR